MYPRSDSADRHRAGVFPIRETIPRYNSASSTSCASSFSRQRNSSTLTAYDWNLTVAPVSSMYRVNAGPLRRGVLLFFAALYSEVGAPVTIGGARSTSRRLVARRSLWARRGGGFRPKTGSDMRGSSQSDEGKVSGAISLKIGQFWTGTRIWDSPRSFRGLQIPGDRRQFLGGGGGVRNVAAPRCLTPLRAVPNGVPTEIGL